MGVGTGRTLRLFQPNRSVIPRSIASNNNPIAATPSSASSLLPLPQRSLVLHPPLQPASLPPLCLQRNIPPPPKGATKTDPRSPQRHFSHHRGPCAGSDTSCLCIQSPSISAWHNTPDGKPSGTSAAAHLHQIHTAAHRPLHGWSHIAREGKGAAQVPNSSILNMPRRKLLRSKNHLLPSSSPHIKEICSVQPKQATLPPSPFLLCAHQHLLCNT